MTTLRIWLHSIFAVSNSLFLNYLCFRRNDWLFLKFSWEIRIFLIKSKVKQSKTKIFAISFWELTPDFWFELVFIGVMEIKKIQSMYFINWCSLKCSFFSFFQIPVILCVSVDLSCYMVGKCLTEVTSTWGIRKFIFFNVIFDSIEANLVNGFIKRTPSTVRKYCVNSTVYYRRKKKPTNLKKDSFWNRAHFQFSFDQFRRNWVWI